MSASQQQLDDFEPDLSKLSEKQREAFEAVYQDGVSPREFARQQGKSYGTVSNHLMRARSKLDVFQDGETDG